MFRASKKHLREVGEGYFQHLLFASLTALRLLGAALAILLHALVPALFPRTGSRVICTLYQKIQKRL